MDTRKVRVVQPPRPDYLRVVGHGEPEDFGFTKRDNRYWRPGWWMVRRERDGRPPMLIADAADKHAMTWPQPWGVEHFHVTRVDVCCDLTGVTFREDHAVLFTHRGERTLHYNKHKLATVEIGRRKSPLMLRIYLKSKHCTEDDRHRWARHGWDGSDVWRIEYELHTRALPRDKRRQTLVALPEQVPVLWNDALARIRMCEQPPRGLSQQNKAKTAALWRALAIGQGVHGPVRMTRMQGDLPLPPIVDREAVMASLHRLETRAGVAMLPMMIRKLLLSQRLARR